MRLGWRQRLIMDYIDRNGWINSGKAAELGARTKRGLDTGPLWRLVYRDLLKETPCDCKDRRHARHFIKA